MSEWIDVSVPLTPQTVCWPGDQPFESSRDCSTGAGDECTVTSFRMSSHLGTHIDAPLHYFGNGPSLDSLPLDAVIGPARVVAVEGTSICAGDVERFGIARGERILFKTANSQCAWQHQPFTRQYVHLTTDAARWLSRRGPALVGMDYLSVGSPDSDGAETHRVLLAAGIWIVEALNLNGIEPGSYELLCLPLRIAAAEGAPVRAVLRRI